jgi:hypothetical protein
MILFGLIMTFCSVFFLFFLCNLFRAQPENILVAGPEQGWALKVRDCFSWHLVAYNGIAALLIQ